LRLGLVKFGTGAWQIDTIRQHGLDTQAGIRLDTVDLANPAAGEVSLQAGGVDAIVSDWLWVTRQRRAGQRITFIAQNDGLGDIIVPQGSPIHSLADLAGKRLGIAGGPIDKSWLLVRAFSRKTLGHDLADQVTPVYAAPPLLSQEMEAGRIDAVLIYWPYAARLEVKGYRSLMSMTEVMAGLGFAPAVPMMGYAVSEAWIDAHPGALPKFLTASAEATTLMRASDEEWTRLRPLTAAEDDATLLALRDRYRASLAIHWDEAAAAKLYGSLAELGGAALTGGATEITPGTFFR